MYQLLVSLARSIAPKMRGVSIYQAEEMLQQGRISNHDYRVYCLFWLWSVPRFGVSSNPQWQYLQRRGGAAILRRRELFIKAGKEGGLY
jgi:hypothetical protein